MHIMSANAWFVRQSLTPSSDSAEANEGAPRGVDEDSGEGGEAEADDDDDDDDEEVALARSETNKQTETAVQGGLSHLSCGL